MSNTLIVTTASAAVLWEYELKGQMSDGMWENSGPREHWRFWCGTDVEIGVTPGLLRANDGSRPNKTAYAFDRLIPIVGDRMIALGRMGLAMQAIGFKADENTLYKVTRAAEYLALSAIDRGGYVAAVTPELRAAFDAAKYDVKALRADLKMISAVMKGAA